VLQCVAVCCSVLQRVAACCSVLQCVDTKTIAVHIGVCVVHVLRCVAVCCSASQRVAVCCSMVQCDAVCCSVLQCLAACCSVLQCVDTRIIAVDIGLRVVHEHVVMAPEECGATDPILYTYVYMYKYTHKHTKSHFIEGRSNVTNTFVYKFMSLYICI